MSPSSTTEHPNGPLHCAWIRLGCLHSAPGEVFFSPNWCPAPRILRGSGAYLDALEHWPSTDMDQLKQPIGEGDIILPQERTSNSLMLIQTIGSKILHPRASNFFFTTGKPKMALDDDGSRKFRENLPMLSSLDILVAATDTTAATTVWAMTALIKYPRVMKKVQEEIRNLGGNKEFLDEDDIQKFPYFKAVIKETLRLHPPAPLLVQRETNEKCVLDGYEIPAKTIVYVNAWAIHRDPEAWKDPNEFLPERFFDSDTDFRGQDFELIPFGGGRRICPGMSMAITSLDIILANLLNSFDWELPPGFKKEDIDTEVLPGLTQHKKNPLCVLAKTRI
ncbi:hypothetical protein VNO77_07208 [Canavalia gladiata]|uniref:Cytochrome P450 n=1 Tax=Canavalia gladiata TaxID=3824 RepID=A0AAN9M8E5_CANGL